LKENLGFGAYAIRTGDDDGLFVGGKNVSCCKQAEGVAELTVFLRALYVRADVTDKRLCLNGIDTGLLVCEIA
ncbi:MAG: hypothetical protein IKW19_06865, partial [Akkermansia sp.]|nr:hypothetical protein [Akkermansia sp.]